MAEMKQQILEMKTLENYEYQDTLNQEPWSEDRIRETLNRMKDIDSASSKKGRTSGNYYFGTDQKHKEFISDVSKDFLYSNVLHFSDTKGSLQIENELILFMKNLMNGDENTLGTTTSGGTESIILGLCALRTMAHKRGIKHPHIISSTTAHAALMKGSYYLGIELTLLEINEETGKSNFNEMINSIKDNTIAFYLSGINFPHGNVDDIQMINDYLMGRTPGEPNSQVDLQRQKKLSHIGILVDSCLGGFFTSMSTYLKDGRFQQIDFKNERVVCITVDPHKYGQGPKGCSVVLFRNLELKIASMFLYSKWQGGLYGTPGLAGSRTTAGFVGSWASLKKLGMKGLELIYTTITSRIDSIVEDVKNSKQFTVYGNPKGCSIAVLLKKEFRKKYSIIVINHILKIKKNWSFSLCFDPSCIHISITMNNVFNLETFPQDLQEAFEEYEANYKTYSNMSFTEKSLYGAVVDLPDNLSDDIVGHLLSYMNMV
jgi:sphinganine-1-phosphate aldolase